MGSLKITHRLLSRRRAGVGAFSAMAALLVAAACSDQPPVAPRQVAPGNAALSISPTFAQLPPGGPVIPLSRLRAVLTAPNGDLTNREVPFVGDSAVLFFEVPIAGASVQFSLALTAFDTQGAVAYTSVQQLILHPGDNPLPQSPVLVYDGPDVHVAAVHIAPGSLTLAALGSTTLTATGTTASGQPVPSLRVGWTSKDPTVATVDETGAVKAGPSQGTTTIIARAANNAADSVTIKVHAPVDRVVITTPALSLIRGKSSPATVELRDATNHLIDDRTAAWSSSDASVASVSATGSVTGVKVGKATLTASAEGKSATLTVTVTSSVDHIELSPSPLQFTSLKQSIPLVTKIVAVAGGSVDGIVPKFTSAAPTVATVDSTGVVTAVSNGTAKITAEVDGQTATVDAVVAQVAVTVAVSPKVSSVASLSQPAILTTTAADAKANKIDAPKVTWASADTTIATVSGTGVAGVVTPHQAGTTQITATIDGKSDTSTFIVAQIPAMIIIVPSQPQIQLGKSITLSAKLADAGGNPIRDVVAAFTTTTPNLVSIQGNTVTGTAPGIAHILASSSQYTAALSIPVGSPSAQMVVLGDAGFMGDGAVEFIGASQLTFLDNLFHNPSGGARSQNSWVMFYRGHQSICAGTGFCGPSTIGMLRDHLALQEITVIDTTDATQTALSDGLDPNVSVLVLMLPTTPFNSGEIARLKQFAAQGGRIVFMGGRVEDYGGFVDDVENAFLAAMGSSIVAKADDQWCDKTALTGASLKPHQLTTGVTQLSFGCASSMSLGATGTAVLLDGTLTFVIGGVTTIDLTGASVAQTKRPTPNATPTTKAATVRRP